jgi:two-component system sensor kinase FixL
MLRTAKVEAVVRCGRRVPAVIGNRIEMTQVLVNIVRNAIEAMESVPVDGRRLTIETRSPDGGRTVAVSVTDTGAGFAEQVLNQPFKPFRSTKAGGLGLGLSICRRILDAHGGRLELGRGRARGATVRVVLPTAHKETV